MQQDDDSTLAAAVAQARDRTSEAARVSITFYHRDGTSLLELKEPNSVVVGRAFPSDLVIAEPSLSRMHARFTWSGEALSVTDLESKNHTWLAGKAIQESQLQSGDELVLGSVTASIHVLRSPELVTHGIDNYARMTRRLHEEVLRAREFKRPLALIMLRELSDRAQPAQHVGHLLPGLPRLLRAVDAVGIYDERTAMVLLPELGLAAARAAGESLMSHAREQGAELTCGLALFPDDAASDEELLSRCRRACLGATPERRLVAATEAPEQRSQAAAQDVVRDPVMQALFRTVRQIAPRGLPVLIVGETGVGKEVVAAALHEASGRKGPLKVINCATIPDTLTESILFGHERGAFTGAAQRSSGLFEDADGGTVFLDEIGELSAAAQASLLRVLQEKRIMRVGSTRELEVDVRVVAATHRDLEDMVAQGHFRKDLLYRLNAVTLEVPPLRERRSEIAVLAQRFLEDAIAEWGGSARDFSQDVTKLLEGYDWPGNVRQLRNVVERAAALCERARIEAEDLPSTLRETVGLASESRASETSFPGAGEPEPGPGSDHDFFKDKVRDYESALIRDALDKTQGNLTRAAELLRMPIRTLSYKLKALGIKAK